MEEREYKAPDGYLELRRKRTYILYAAVYLYFLIVIIDRYRIIDLSILRIPGLSLIMPFHNYILAIAASVFLFNYLFGTRIYKKIYMQNYDQLKAFSRRIRIFLFAPILLLSIFSIKEALLLAFVFVTVYIWFARAYRPIRPEYDYFDRYDIHRYDRNGFK